jgi:uncharacterized protein (UPF0216 family)
MKQTAMQQLIEALELKVMAQHIPWVQKTLDDALEMERQQIEFFYKQGHLHSGCPYGLEEVYKKTFQHESND